MNLQQLIRRLSFTATLKIPAKNITDHFVANGLFLPRQNQEPSMYECMASRGTLVSILLMQ